MTDIKITQLTSGSSLDASDIIPFVSGSSTTPQSKYIRADNLFTNIASDVYSTPWTDYSSISTITGWSSFTTKSIFYKKVGNLVFVEFIITGTSNATNASATLPFSKAAGVSTTVMIRSRDNTGLRTVGLATLGSSTMAFYPTPAGGTWTDSGTKEVYGQFFYESA